MKINNFVVDVPKEEFLVIPKGNQDWIFKAKAVSNWDEFEKICPTPQPPSKMKRGETQPTSDFNDKGYKKDRDKWALSKTSWLFLESISATDGIEWDTIDMGNPDTWENYVNDLKSAGFFDNEIALLVELVATANGLNEQKIKEATGRFLAAMEAEQEK